MNSKDLRQLDLWLSKECRVQLPEAEDCDTDFSVSVIIPTHRKRPIGLEAFQAQQGVCEVITLINGALDLEIEGGRRVVWQGHSRTRQAAVSQAQGDFVLFSVDDALPRGTGCVREMVNGLRQGHFDAVTGRQLPWPDSDPFTQDRLVKWTPAGDECQAWNQVDNVFALYPKELLLRDPFPDVPIAEDLHWSVSHNVGYVPTAPIVHAHKRSPGSLYKRTRALHVEHCRIGEPPRVPNLTSLIRAIPSALKMGFHYGAGEIPNQLAELLGQYQGAKMLRTHPKP